MPYAISKDFTFAAAHRIDGHAGPCRHLHGHNYRVRVRLAADRLDALGMVVDFADLKAMIEQVAGPFDHRVINDVPPFDQLPTTAEQLAEHVYRGIAERLDDPRVRLERVEVWENDTSCAIYSE
ncbi:MAG: 6-carboxytetrahydropterin synthase QueD [Acidobacteria bacterium]|nr:MAG: 6-carboxytetrahydropterin synthase QueD [Acidobacteriota bacterium]